MFDFLIHEQLYLLAVHAEFLEDEGAYVLRLLQYAFQQVYGFDGLLAVQLCAVNCLLHSLLGFNGKLV